MLLFHKAIYVLRAGIALSILFSAASNSYAASATSVAEKVDDEVDIPVSEDVDPLENVISKSDAVPLKLPSISATPSEIQPPEGTPEYNVVVLQGLNKVTGHISKLQGPLGTVMNFGTLEIIARKCWKAAPEERPENAALLEIRETKADEAPKSLFVGWMFSSSPALSGLENPVYDITMIACEQSDDPEKGLAVATPTKTKDVAAPKNDDKSEKPSPGKAVKKTPSSKKKPDKADPKRE